MGLKRPTIEIPLLLTFFSFELLGPINTNLMIYRTCYIILGYNESECALLGNSENSTIQDLEKKVEPEVNIIDTTKGTVEQVVGLIMCLFAGQWSDKFGRKPILLLSQTGMVFGLLIMTILSYCPNVSPWYFMISAIPGMLTGGVATFIVTVLSYISDLSTNETRGIRMATMEGIIAAGMLLGNLCSSYLFYATNYPSVYAIAAGIVMTSMVYIYFFVPESLETVSSDVKFEDIVKSVDFKDMYRVFSKPREHYTRAIIWLITGILSVYVFLSSGDGKTFLFLRVKFGWNLSQYTIYNAACSVLFVFGAVLGTFVLNNWLQVTESVTILMGLISGMNGSLVRGLATSNFHIYFASAVRCLSGIISPQCRTLIGKLVPSEEIAKIFSLIMVVEFVLGIGANPLYTFVYNATVDTDPGFFNFISVGLFIIDIILIIYIMVLEFKSPANYQTLKNEENGVNHVIPENEPQRI